MSMIEWLTILVWVALFVLIVVGAAVAVGIAALLQWAWDWFSRTRSQAP